MRLYFILTICLILFGILFFTINESVTRVQKLPLVTVALKKVQVERQQKQSLIYYQVDWNKTNPSFVKKSAALQSTFDQERFFSVSPKIGEQVDDLIKYNLGGEDIKAVFGYKPGIRPVFRRLILPQ